MRARRAAAWIGGALSALAAAAPAAAGDRGAISLVLENDLFDAGRNDRNYTNGVKVAYLTPPGAEPKFVREVARALPGYEPDDDLRVEFEAGQAMYTPEDLTLRSPDPNDRPYAGLAYGAVGLIKQSRRAMPFGLRSNYHVLDQAQVVLGVVGPSSGAATMQRWVHERIGAIDPKGWDDQIPDQAAYAVRLQQTVLLPSMAGEGRRFGFEVLPTWGVSVGNIETSANVGLGFRVGVNLPTDFGPARIAPALPGSTYFEPNADAGVYLFGGVSGRYVGARLVLDERSRSGAKVDREPLVGDLQAGLTGYVGGVSVSYTHVWRTREFEEQRAASDNFGAVSVTARF